MSVAATRSQANPNQQATNDTRPKADGIWCRPGEKADRGRSRLAQAYAALAPMRDVVAAAPAERRIAGILIEGDEVQMIALGGLTLGVPARRRRVSAIFSIALRRAMVLTANAKI